MNDPKMKQEIVEKITSSNNVLVSVSNSPSVDALSAALALTMMLNKIGKHTTAIFSGAIPPAITFLDPQKTFEASTDSLRDFIIALDKEKADHLRYKVDGDMVKIFITPYRTTISSDDLEFSQGDYNVELVLALAVDNQSHLDGALEAHGSILHDATVITISAGQQSSSLGSIDWRDDQASSLSEMLVDLADALKTDVPILDDQISTALLTGIVAETDRFSNTKTSSKVMTIAAQLMAAGADQQLIAAKLQESHEIGVQAPVGAVSMIGNTIVPEEAGGSQGSLAISHSEVASPDQPEPLASSEPSVVEEVTPSPIVSPQPQPSADPVIKIADAYALDPEASVEPEVVATPTVAPLLGGVASPTNSELPQPTKVVDSNAHSYLSDDLSSSPSSSGDMLAGHSNAPLSTSPDPVTPPAMPSAPPLATELASRDESSRNDALAAVNATFDAPATPQPSPVQPSAQPFMPAPGISLPPPPPVPDFSAFPTAGTMASAYALDPTPVAPAPATAPAAPAPAPSEDPAQFRIPGQ